jgi:hypothetical protein
MVTGDLKVTIDTCIVDYIGGGAVSMLWFEIESKAAASWAGWAGLS